MSGDAIKKLGSHGRATPGPSTGELAGAVSQISHSAKTRMTQRNAGNGWAGPGTREEVWTSGAVVQMLGMGRRKGTLELLEEDLVGRELIYSVLTILIPVGSGLEGEGRSQSLGSEG